MSTVHCNLCLVLWFSDDAGNLVWNISPQTPINGDTRNNFSQPGFMNEIEMRSQTQNETQCFEDPDSDKSNLKRKQSRNDGRLGSKRQKISVVEGIDIEE